MDRQDSNSLEKYRVLGAGEGKLVLEELYEQFWGSTSTYQPGVEPIDLAFREGQRSVVVQLVETVREALLGEVPVTTTRPEESE